jgi:DNA-binding response OmpR family regulator
MRILLIEDYQPLRESISQGLREAGFAVDATPDGAEGLSCARTREYDVILLDLMLPGMDGLSVLQDLRDRRNSVHVLVITAMDAENDQIRGLDLGADDYLVKPFSLEVLLARVRALVRRRYTTKSPVIRVADLEIDTGTRIAYRAEQAVELTAREYAVLEYLAHRIGQPVTRSAIREHVYGFNDDPFSNVIDVYVASLRKKLERHGMPRLIHTRRGIGYVLGDPI